MYATMPINIGTLVSYAESEASAGEIDDTSNLCNTRVYLYSGSGDTVVNPTVMRALETFYSNFLTCSAANITTQFSIDSEHCIPTTDYGNDCTDLGEPYINNCDYDGAGDALEVIYKSLSPKTQANPSNVRKLKYQASRTTILEIFYNKHSQL